MTLRMLRHNRVELALHELRGGDPDRPLLILHGLGGRSPDALPDWAAAWPGSVHALDFTGHGRSTVPIGGGYNSEILLADADVALGVLGRPTVVGFGLGGYVALLLAGARPGLVRGAVVCDGTGLDGTTAGPAMPNFVSLPARELPPDPYALLELSRELRPVEYVVRYARLAHKGSSFEDPVSVAARARPSWLEAVVTEPGVVVRPRDEALARYATL